MSHYCCNCGCCRQYDSCCTHTNLLFHLVIWTDHLKETSLWLHISHSGVAFPWHWLSAYTARIFSFNDFCVLMSGEYLPLKANYHYCFFLFQQIIVFNHQHSLSAKTPLISSFTQETDTSLYVLLTANSPATFPIIHVLSTPTNASTPADFLHTQRCFLETI